MKLPPLQHTAGVEDEEEEAQVVVLRSDRPLVSGRVNS